VDHFKPADSPLRCPVSHCTGWVSQVTSSDEPAFWGCGECGAIWYREESLGQEIADIVVRYPYRAPCYTQTGGTWHPAPVEAEHSDYEDLVQTEPWDERSDFTRG
jgi:hypothetical protein